MFRDGVTRADAAVMVRARLRSGNVATPDTDARLLLQHVTSLDQLELMTRADVPLTQAERERLDDLVARRLGGTPVARLLGYRDFWDLRFWLSPDTLEPRPDSETIIEEALDQAKALPHMPRRVLDLGTGTGCLLIALLTEWPDATGLGTDISSGALLAATANADANGVAGRARFRQGSWADTLDERFDIIVTNPPYITSDDLDRLMPEVLNHDPARALDGGTDGLAAYRIIIAQLPGLLAHHAVAVLEIGAGQEADIRRLATLHGLEVVGTRRDLGDHVRAVSLRTVPKD